MKYVYGVVFCLVLRGYDECFLTSFLGEVGRTAVQQLPFSPVYSSSNFQENIRQNYMNEINNAVESEMHRARVSLCEESKILDEEG